MNDNERVLIRFVCEGNMKKAQDQARIILGGISSKRDEQFRDNMLRKLDAKKDFIELPYNLKSLLIAEDSRLFPEAKFLLREAEMQAVDKTISLYRAANRLAELGIPYLPALILYGESGCGKTELARYIAHKAELPFVYVRFSSVVDSHLGGTQSNVTRIFEYARSNPCVLCFDEIDAIGMARGQEHELGEMSRVVIALMQELDQLPNNVIIIGTTNRFESLDPALVRRFPLRHELKPLCESEIFDLACRFFRYAGVDTGGWIGQWFGNTFGKTAPASTVVRECTDVIVGMVLKEDRA